MANENLSRRLDTGASFMDYRNGNDLLYGYLAYLATYNPKTKQLYLTYSKFLKEKKTISTLLNQTPRTTERQLEKMLERGTLLKAGTINMGEGREQVPCYYFQYAGKSFNVVQNEMLFYLVKTRTKMAVRIYNFLLNAYKLSVATKNSEPYQFTITEIKKKLGYSNTTKTIDDVIKTTLESFSREGIIHYTETYVLNNKQLPMPVKMLDFVAQRINDLAPINSSTPIIQQLKEQNEEEYAEMEYSFPSY